MCAIFSFATRKNVHMMEQGMITTNLLAFLGFQLIFLFEKIKIHCRKSKLQTIGGSEHKEKKFTKYCLFKVVDVVEFAFLAFRPCLSNNKK